MGRKSYAGSQWLQNSLGPHMCGKCSTEIARLEGELWIAISSCRL